MSYELFNIDGGQLSCLEVRGPNGTVRISESESHGWIVSHCDKGAYPSLDEALDRAKKIVGEFFD